MKESPTRVTTHIQACFTSHLSTLHMVSMGFSSIILARPPLMMIGKMSMKVVRILARLIVFILLFLLGSDGADVAAKLRGQDDPAWGLQRPRQRRRHSAASPGGHGGHPLPSHGSSPHSPCHFLPSAFNCSGLSLGIDSKNETFLFSICDFPIS